MAVFENDGNNALKMRRRGVENIEERCIIAIIEDIRIEVDEDFFFLSEEQYENLFGITLDRELENSDSDDDEHVITPIQVTQTRRGRQTRPPRYMADNYI